MAAETAGVAVTTPTDVGLKRELGLIGATWASETSIIGSGWLFAPLTAALLIGGGAVLDWIIAGIVVIILALAGVVGQGGSGRTVIVGAIILLVAGYLLYKRGQRPA